MSITKKLLKGLNLEDDVIETILDAHIETVNGLKEQMASYKEDSEKLQNVQRELDELKANTADYEDIKTKYTAEKQAFDDFKKNIEHENNMHKVKDAYKALLKAQNVDEKRLDAILKVTDFNGKKLDKEGKFENEKELVSAIKADWGDFIVTSEERGAQVETPPANSGGTTFKSKDEIMKIKDTEERQKAIADNPELFGIA